jgi:hypothetical protein
MIFNAFQREEADNVFTVVRNVTGAALAAGEAVVWDVTSPDGVRVTKSSSSTTTLFRGIVTETSIADSAYGKAIVHGYYASAKITNSATTAIVAGDVLACADDVAYLERAAAGTGYSGTVFAAAAVATGATPASAASGVFVRAL